MMKCLLKPDNNESRHIPARDSNADRGSRSSAGYLRPAASPCVPTITAREGVSRAGSKRARRRFLQRAAAARSLARGAAIAMAADPDRSTLDLGFQQIAQVQALARVVFERQIEHLIEVAVIDVAAPIDRNQVSAHHVVEIGVEVCALQQVEVAIELAVGNEDRAETLDRHVGERIELVEND